MLAEGKKAMDTQRLVESGTTVSSFINEAMEEFRTHSDKLQLLKKVAKDCGSFCVQSLHFELSSMSTDDSPKAAEVLIRHWTIR